MPKFKRYIGIDYSGAQTPTASLKGLRVYLAEGDAAPVENPPPGKHDARAFPTHLAQSRLPCTIKTYWNATASG